jgi:hypothetical protein
MRPHTMFRAACVGLAVALAACTASNGRVRSATGEAAGNWLRAHGLIPAGGEVR